MNIKNDSIENLKVRYRIVTQYNGGFAIEKEYNYGSNDHWISLSGHFLDVESAKKEIVRLKNKDKFVKEVVFTSK